MRESADSTLRERLVRLREAPLVSALARAAAPARVWLVGGAVRDAVTGHATKDVDAVLERDAAGVADRLAHELSARLVPLGGDRFAALRLVAADGEIDLWDLAGEPLAPDLARRDFTINAMALDLASGELVDPHDGRADLERRILRATRPTVFAEDPLRVLRLARFAATLAFEMEPATCAAARAVAPDLPGIPGERIRAELVQLWRRAPGFAVAQAALEASGAWPALWREPGAEGAVTSALPAALEVDRRATGADADERDDLLACGEVLCASAAAGAAAADVLARRCERRALARSELASSLRLLALAGESAPRDDAETAWFTHRCGPGFPLAFGLGAARAIGAVDRVAAWRRAGRRALALVKTRGDEILRPVALLDGDGIAARLGLAPGPELGLAVRRLREAQVRGEVRTPADAERWLGRYS